MAKSILIADDQESIRRALCRLFAAQDDFDVCGDAENGLEAIEMAQLLKPDLILLGLSMPVMTGVEAAYELKRLMPMVPIIVFSEYDDAFWGAGSSCYRHFCAPFGSGAPFNATRQSSLCTLPSGSLSFSPAAPNLLSFIELVQLLPVWSG